MLLMNKSLIIAGIVGVGLGASSPAMLHSLLSTESPPARPVIAENNLLANEASEGSGNKNELALATSPRAEESARSDTPSSSYEQALKQVEADNSRLKGEQAAYYNHTAEVRKESDKLFRQEQRQGNIRAQENLAAARLQERKDEASEREYNAESGGGYWNNWSNGDWNHVNRWSNGYIWRP